MATIPEKITDDERTLVKYHVILPLVLTAFERDAAIMRETLKTPEPYIESIELAMNIATHDITEIKRQFRSRGIKVYELTRDPDAIHAKYQCRGYHGQMTLRWAFIAPEAAILMRKYLGLDISQYDNVVIPESLRIKR